MTFSLVARCERTGQIGAAIATYAIGVGARGPWLAPGNGGVLCQALADPRLGIRGLDLLREGRAADEVIRALVQEAHRPELRQLAVVDRFGRTAHHHGAEIRDFHEAAHGAGVVAIGNSLANPRGARAMVEAFERSDEPLAERLMSALEAGQAAGGQAFDGQPITTFSAGLKVFADQLFPLVDLRVDLKREAIAELRVIWDAYTPLVDEFVLRAVAPEKASTDPRLFSMEDR